MLTDIFKAVAPIHLLKVLLVSAMTPLQAIVLCVPLRLSPTHWGFAFRQWIVKITNTGITELVSML